MKPKTIKPAPKPVFKPEPSKPLLYRACKDVGFKRGWKAEPVDYRNIGIVYLFDTETEAIEKANEKNKEATKRK